MVNLVNTFLGRFWAPGCLFLFPTQVCLCPSEESHGTQRLKHQSLYSGASQGVQW